MRARRVAIGVSVFVLAAALVMALLAQPLLRQFRRLRYPLQYVQQVERWSEDYDVDKYLVYAVIHTESGFDAKAESKAGARGLMQMTEDTFRWLLPNVAPGEDLTFEDLFNPEVSIRFGTFYLGICLARYGGDMGTAAAAYHSGWGTVDSLLKDSRYSPDGQCLASFPYAQMNHYVYKVNKAYGIYYDIYEGMPLITTGNEEKT